MYEWIKALHLIAVISWMAGMLYLRGCSSTLRGRDRIKTVRDVQGDGTPAVEGDHQPAMIVTWLAGFYLAWRGHWFASAGCMENCCWS